MLGYPSEIDGYKIWLLDEKKCFIIRDVIFDEFLFYKNVKSLEESNQPSLNFFYIQYNNLLGDTTKESIQGASQILEDDDQGGEIDQGEEIEDPLHDYVLSRDKTRRTIRTIRPLTKHAHTNLIAFALHASSCIRFEEPATYLEA